MNQKEKAFIYVCKEKKWIRQLLIELITSVLVVGLTLGKAVSWSE